MDHLHSLHVDDRGHLILGWAIVLIGVVLPLATLAPPLLELFASYYYRIVGITGLPFP